MNNEWNQNIKKRREQQVRLLKQGVIPTVNHSFRPWGKEWEPSKEQAGEAAPWNQTVQKDSAKRKREKRMMFQLIISAVLLVFTFLILQSSSPSVKPAEQFVTEVMTRDFNFAGLSDWYKQYVGKTPGVLPAFFAENEGNSPLPSSTWKVPVKGEIVLPFDEQRKGVVIRTAPRAKVKAATEGWVTFAGYKEGLGNTVILQHANGRETWYGRLENLKVREKDWVKSGQLIGEAGQTKGQSLVYIALKEGKQFVNPASVIQFE
ncbi:peptidoglycan DD-metalloendopeptidase family protein [Paenactinomyces guangxiensis]|uniref:M23 family metallopeptidase n=1 Tax=Paenactinomyces guangxiensis TaxID=1490290 RepID=A0A7W2AAF7_9BACL|nr:M23 family metallopeptidase [Paenactinomyces guangxiensis]MBA4496159.1 M23 family metallopeptidase [Paenactinomyces guangxiensis]MBH8593247.1 M23 family metallopeptidase [Paenactinomyces guangxiensis]